MKIGVIKKLADGTFTGEIKTLAMYAKVRMIPTDATGKHSPDFRLHAGDFEIGAAWIRHSKAGNEYISVKLDCPTFAKPVFAACFANDTQPEAYDMLWNRDEAK